MHKISAYRIKDVSVSFLTSEDGDLLISVHLESYLSPLF